MQLLGIVKQARTTGQTDAGFSVLRGAPPGQMAERDWAPVRPIDPALQARLLMCNKKWSEQAPASEHRVYQNVSNLGMMAAPRNQDHGRPFKRAMLDGSSLGSTRKANRSAATVPGAIRFILGLPFSSNPNPTRRVRKARLHIKPTETICSITRAGMR